jgi:hypothetical protein
MAVAAAKVSTRRQSAAGGIGKSSAERSASFLMQAAGDARGRIARDAREEGSEGFMALLITEISRFVNAKCSKM